MSCLFCLVLVLRKNKRCCHTAAILGKQMAAQSVICHCCCCCCCMFAGCCPSVLLWPLYFLWHRKIMNCLWVWNAVTFSDVSQNSSCPSVSVRVINLKWITGVSIAFIYLSQHFVQSEKLAALFLTPHPPLLEGSYAHSCRDIYGHVWGADDVPRGLRASCWLKRASENAHFHFGLCSHLFHLLSLSVSLCHFIALLCTDASLCLLFHFSWLDLLTLCHPK